MPNTEYVSHEIYMDTTGRELQKSADIMAIYNAADKGIITQEQAMTLDAFLNGKHESQLSELEKKYGEDFYDHADDEHDSTNNI